MKKFWIVIVLLAILSPVGAQDSGETTQVPPYGAYMDVLTCGEEEALHKLPSEWQDSAAEHFNAAFITGSEEEPDEDELNKAVHDASCGARLRSDHWEPWADLSKYFYYLTGDIEKAIDLHVLAYDLGWGDAVENLPTRNRNFARAAFEEDPEKRVELYLKAIGELKANGAPQSEIGGVYEELVREYWSQDKPGEAYELLNEAQPFMSSTQYPMLLGWTLVKRAGIEAQRDLIIQAVQAFSIAGTLGDVYGYLQAAETRYTFSNEVDWDSAGMPGVEFYLSKAATLLCPQLAALYGLEGVRGELEDENKKLYLDMVLGGTSCLLETPSLDFIKTNLPDDSKAGETYKLAVARRLIADHEQIAQYDGAESLDTAERYILEVLNQRYLGIWSNYLSSLSDSQSLATIAFSYWEEAFNTQNALWTRRAALQRHELDAPYLPGRG